MFFRIKIMILYNKMLNSKLYSNSKLQLVKEIEQSMHEHTPLDINYSGLNKLNNQQIWKCSADKTTSSFGSSHGSSKNYNKYDKSEDWAKKIGEHIYERQIARGLISDKIKAISSQLQPFLDQNQPQHRQRQHVFTPINPNFQIDQQNVQNQITYNKSMKNTFKAEQCERLKLENSILKAELKGLKKLIFQYEQQIHKNFEAEIRPLKCNQSTQTQKIFNEELTKAHLIHKQQRQKQNEIKRLQSLLQDKEKQLTSKGKTIDFLIQEKQKLQNKLNQKTQKTIQYEFPSKVFEIAEKCYKERQQKMIKKLQLVKKYLINEIKDLKAQHKKIKIDLSKQLLVFSKLNKFYCNEMLKQYSEQSV